MKNLLALAALLLAGTRPQTAPPNVVVILADDLGYGDVGCYGATKIRTPNIDRLAAGGLRFTDGHSPSATCTPTRYALLTGEYAWRKGIRILPGDAALIIEPGRPTLASVLKKAGYATGVVGKWHLGLGKGNVNWNGCIEPGPLEIGFDYSFLMPATGDRVPCVYVENHHVVGLDPADPIRVRYGAPVGDERTGQRNPELLKLKPSSRGHDHAIVHGIGRIGYMTGGTSALWVDGDMADVFAKKAEGFIEKHKDRPFFLYLATHDIHVPRLPHARFAGKSGCGVRGDAAEELDDTVGQVLAALDRLKLAENTLVVFSSDNGPVVDDGYADGAVENLNGHRPAGPLRGGKYSTYEGGTRVPFIARWPARIKPGVSDALVGLVDLVASFAALAGKELPREAGPDSLNVLPALLGESKEGRDHLVEHARDLALRKGPWKFIPARGKGPGELFNLADDLGESKNLAAQKPELAGELSALLEKLRADGRTRP